MRILDFFLFLWVILPSWIRIRNLNEDPDPATKINADPCGSGSKTLPVRHVVPGPERVQLHLLPRHGVLLAAFLQHNTKDGIGQTSIELLIFIHPGSRIQQQIAPKEGEHFFVLPFFVATNIIQL